MSTVDEIKELNLLVKAAAMVRYDAETGSITWIAKPPHDATARRWNGKHAGKECGHLMKDGYRRITFKFESGGALYRILAHRLAWFIANGRIPCVEVDHINQNKADNRLANLREVSKSLNMRNMPRAASNTSGVCGVYWNKVTKRWFARVGLERRVHNLGTFESLAEAAKVVKAFRSANGFTDMHGAIRASKLEVSP